MHYETFEVVTEENGASSLKFDLACATAIDHYTRCTKLGEKQLNTSNSVCSTGLRVYEGAQVLAAFLSKFGASLVSSLSEDCSFEKPKYWALELGCGCGLVGFTTATLFPQLSVAFTDASVDCLNLINASAKKLGLSLLKSDGTDPAEIPEGTDGRLLLSYPLEWCEQGTTRLASLLRRLSGHRGRMMNGAVRMVLGSDLLYYRVDIRALLGTCKSLLNPYDSGEDKEDDHAFSVPRFVVLAHFMRIPDGDRKLQMAAYELGFGIVRVPLEAFVTAEVVRRRGWNGISVVLLFLRSSRDFEPQSLGKGSAWDRREEEDLLEARMLFCGSSFSLPLEALTRYSRDAAKCNADGTRDAVDQCDLDTLPYRVE
ncbi:hypothetical protein DQ04_05061000 [Trypanosoma grayi]|uniref:hypothetical protein n=1 Tax=Trypanosoma grayi TaxID=71804 RepID=UPI0004F4B124|nr:hypothetical protein DQ04_05061000 [Trypanosoma grayi]KEG09535.1 hypothetical protein DQ04_05061000 [Trypanosoma grayi]